MKSALQEPLANGQVRCNVCAYRCELSEGQVGVCRVRHNVGGEIQYEADQSGWNACGIMDKCSAGTYCTNKPGCNWSCSFCSSVQATNPEHIPAATGRKPRDVAYPGNFSPKVPTTHDGFVDRKTLRGNTLTLLPILDFYKRGAIATGTPDNESVLAAWRKSGSEWFCIRATEPSIHFESVRDVFRQVKAEGGNILINTNGYWTPELVAELGPLVDVVEVGIKGSGNPTFLRKVAGVPKPEPIFETIKGLVDLDRVVMVSDIPVYHSGFKEDVAKLSEFVAMTIPKRDTPRLRIYPWNMQTPWKYFGHFKPGFPRELAELSTMHYSRPELTLRAARIALRQLESVWVATPDFARPISSPDDERESSIRVETAEMYVRAANVPHVIEGASIRLARTVEDLGSLYEGALVSEEWVNR